MKPEMRRDNPGKRYDAGFKLPKGVRNKEALIDTVVRDTIRYFR